MCANLGRPTFGGAPKICAGLAALGARLGGEARLLCILPAIPFVAAPDPFLFLAAVATGIVWRVAGDSPALWAIYAAGGACLIGLYAVYLVYLCYISARVDCAARSGEANV